MDCIGSDMGDWFGESLFVFFAEGLIWYCLFVGPFRTVLSELNFFRHGGAVARRKPRQWCSGSRALAAGLWIELAQCCSKVVTAFQNKIEHEVT